MHVLKRKATKHNGGPAFPFGQICETTGQPVNGFYDPGMSLRDYFASKTMQAIYARLGGSPSAGSDHDGTLTYIAEGAYQMADAMLAQREK